MDQSPKHSGGNDKYAKFLEQVKQQDNKSAISGIQQAAAKDKKDI